MSTKFMVKRSSDGTFYLGSDKICSDGFIARQICMSVEEYRDFLITKFNGSDKNIFGEVYFNSEEDTNNAKEWVESMYVCNTLTNKKPEEIQRWY